LIAERVVLDAAALRIAERADEMRNPGLFDGRRVGRVGVVGVVARDVGAVGVDAVAPVGVERIGGLLWAVFVDGKAAEVAAVGTGLGGQVEEVEGDTRLGAAGLGVVDPGVDALAVARAGGNALEVPVVGVIGGVLNEAVGVGGIAAVTIERQMEIAELHRGGESAAVDIGVDGLDVGRRVDGDNGGGRPGGERGPARRRAPT